LNTTVLRFLIGLLGSSSPEDDERRRTPRTEVEFRRIGLIVDVSGDRDARAGVAVVILPNQSINDWRA